MNDNFQYLCMIKMNLVPTLVDRKWECPAVSFHTFKKGYAYIHKPLIFHNKQIWKILRIFGKRKIQCKFEINITPAHIM